MIQANEINDDFQMTSATDTIQNNIGISNGRNDNDIFKESNSSNSSSLIDLLISNDPVEPVLPLSPSIFDISSSNPQELLTITTDSNSNALDDLLSAIETTPVRVPTDPTYQTVTETPSHTTDTSKLPTPDLLDMFLSVPESKPAVVSVEPMQLFSEEFPQPSSDLTPSSLISGQTPTETTEKADLSSIISPDDWASQIADTTTSVSDKSLEAAAAWSFVPSVPSSRHASICHTMTSGKTNKSEDASANFLSSINHKGDMFETETAAGKSEMVTTADKSSINLTERGKEAIETEDQIKEYVVAEGDTLEA
eukprot:CAMPEP_0182431490 /NCGR_PEP_ID=MMETSP1167-20130531/49613_1 /TAXON_ID=2988 /ORGANISM="Mallomonas Sp, Strain CCMP3275" /LENGTH=309 /DNA_ID=CAMNT_0024617893 /DNA_START=277 /DNA_END=1203 /DNA_ORIENTATION=+